MEIQDLKLEIGKCLKSFASLILPSRLIPKHFTLLENPDEWEKVDYYNDKLISPKDFISRAITDLNVNLAPLENFNYQEQVKITQTFQSFIAKLLTRLFHYLPFNNEVINLLDFVTINMEKEELQQKILTFKTY